jgi:basic membrane lipoprotein Med (substrate-binding protein (PBP1-ABC) superfamily)
MLRGFNRHCIFLALFSPLLLAPSAGGVAAEGVTVDKVALVTPASRTNQGWDQQAADAITNVAAERGITADIAENAGYDDITPILKDFEAEGSQLIICHASGYQKVCPDFAEYSQITVSVIENPGAVK